MPVSAIEPTPFQLNNLCQQTGCRVLHLVSPGDTISGVVKDFYQPRGHRLWMAMVDQVVRDNPQISNPDLIHPGHVIYLRDPFQFGQPHPVEVADIQKAHRVMTRSSKPTDEYLRRAASIYATATAITAETGKNLLKGVQSDVIAVGESYKQFRLNEISQHKHYQTRTNTFNTMKRKLGAHLNRASFKGQTPSEFFRVSNSTGRKVTQLIAAGVIFGAQEFTGYAYDHWGRQFEILRPVIEIEN